MFYVIDGLDFIYKRRLGLCLCLRIDAKAMNRTATII